MGVMKFEKLKKYKITKKVLIVLIGLGLITFFFYFGWLGPKQTVAFCSAKAVTLSDVKYGISVFTYGELKIEEIPKEDIKDYYYTYKLLKDVCLSGVGI